MAWVGLIDEDKGLFNVLTAAGETGFLEGMQVTIHDEPEGVIPSGDAVRTGTYCFYNNFLDTDEAGTLHEKARIYGLKASASVAIKEDNKVIGALSLYAGEKDYFDENQIKLLQQMGADISFAMDNLRQESNLREAGKQLFLADGRERIAEVLREQERLLSESQRISRTGSWSYDFANPIIWTEETYRLFGVSPETFIPTVESLLKLIHRDDRPIMEAWIAECSAGEMPGEFVFRRSLPDGSIRYLMACGNLLRDAEGKAERIVGTVQNITEHHQIERALQQSEERLRLALNGANIGIFDWDPTSNQLIWSQRAEEIFGFGPGEFGCCYEDFAGRLNPEDLPKVELEIERSKSANDRYAIEYRVVWPDSSIHWVSATGEFSYDAEGQAFRLRGTVEDITDRKATEAGLKLAASVFSHSREGIIITDAAANIVDINEAFTTITGYQRDEVLGMNPRLLKSGRHGPEFYENLWRDLNTKGHWYGEIWNRRKNGEEYVEMISITRVLNGSGQTHNYVALFSDITTMKEHQQQLEHIAHYDALTDLPNRLLLVDRLGQAMANAQRRGSSLALVYLDLDGFKAVNDQHGHLVGDGLLVAVAQRMREGLREVDTLARIGGDEFVAVLVDLENPQDCKPLLERLLRSVADPVTVGETILQVSASIGVTIYPKDEADADQLVRHADHAMYVAKQSGKNRYSLFDVHQDAALKTEQNKLAGVRSAMDRREFVLHYQPKVNMKTGAVIGAEALIRWQHPEQGLLPPTTFLPIVEAHPYGIELGEWVIDTAFAQLTEWHEQNFDLPVSVNIGAHHLQQDGFALRLRERLAAHPTVRPDQIELEILESSALKDVYNASKIMTACCEIGMHFALDDFGTGYSSLTYLRRLPVTMLKIDQSFVRDMLSDPEDLAIIEGVIGLAKAFRYQVIAEGVETASHGERLLALGCDLAQGYAFAKAMPGNDLPGWVANWLQSPLTMQ